MRRSTWFNLTRNSAEEATIDICDVIGSWGVSAETFRQQLRTLGEVKRLTLVIDSPGGSCEDGFTIYDAIRGTNAKVTAHIVGTAASMASVIMLAADTIRIAANGRIMIHRVTAGAEGNADDLDAVAKIARQLEDRIVDLYVARTKRTAAEVKEWMKAQMGTWFFGQEAVDHGFADEVTSDSKARAFKPQWAALFSMLPSALFDSSFIPNPPAPTEAPPMKLTAEQKNRLHALARKPAADLTEAEKSELNSLDAQAKKDGYDFTAAILEEDRRADIASTIKNAVDAAVAPLNTKIDTITSDFAAFRDKAEKGIFAGSAGAPPVNNPGDNAPEKGATLTRSEFSKLSPGAKAKHLREGGKLAD